MMYVYICSCSPAAEGLTVLMDPLYTQSFQKPLIKEYTLNSDKKPYLILNEGLLEALGMHLWLVSSVRPQPFPVLLNQHLDPKSM